MYLEIQVHQVEWVLKVQLVFTKKKLALAIKIDNINSEVIEFKKSTLNSHSYIIVYNFKIRGINLP